MSPEDNSSQKLLSEAAPDRVQEQEQDEIEEYLPPAEEETETLEERLHNYIRWMSVGAAFVVAVILSVAIVAYVNFLQTTKESSQPESESSTVYEFAEMFGVVTQVKDTVVTVYNTEDGFDEFNLAGAKKMTDEYGIELEMEEIVVGSIVQIRYNRVGKAVELFRYSAQAVTLSQVTGVSFTNPDAQADGSQGASTIVIDRKTYTYDKELLVFYRGALVDPGMLTPNMVLDVRILDGHIYSITVLSGEGIIKLNSIPMDYFDSVMILTPEMGAEQEIVLTQDTKFINATEGTTKYRVVADEVTLCEGTLMIPGEGRSVLLSLLPLQKLKGILVFDINVKNAKIFIEEEEYKTDRSITLPYGDYTVTLSAEGYSEAVIYVTVDQPYKIITVDMNALKSQLIISSSMSGSRLYIDGELITTMRGKEVTVPMNPGTYRISVENDGYETLETTVTIRANEADRVLFFTGFKKIVVIESSEPEPESRIESEPTEESGENGDSGNEFSPEG